MNTGFEALDSNTTSGPSDVVLMVSGNLSSLPKSTAAAIHYNEKAWTVIGDAHLLLWVQYAS